MIETRAADCQPDIPVDLKLWYERYFPMVLRRCRALLRREEDALDAAQDVFENIVKAQRSLHGRFPSSLLYTTATNVCLNRLRDLRRRREAAVSDTVVVSDTRRVFPPSSYFEMGGVASRAVKADAVSDTRFDEAAFPVVDSGFEEAEARMLIDHILETESHATRTLLFMYYVDGMSLEETGKTIGLSISGVKKRLAAFNKRARRRIAL
jgi:RNA polymerase sigma-70 factor (ECF subfamily)